MKNRITTKAVTTAFWESHPFGFAFIEKNTVYFFTMICYLSLTINVAGQSWAKVYGGEWLDRGTDIAQANDGGFIITGYTNSFAEGEIEQHGYVIKVDGLGNEEWSYLTAWEDNNYNRADAVVVAPDGGYLILGQTLRNGIKLGIHLLKLSGNGEEEWSKLLLDSLDAYPTDIAPTTDGGYIIGGVDITQIEGHLRNALILKVDSEGNEEWYRSIGDTLRWEGIASIRQTSDGGFILGGSVRTIDVTVQHDSDFLLIKTDGQGNRLWTRTFGLNSTISNDADRGRSVLETSDGGYAIAGDYDGVEKILVVKTDVNGNEEWSTFVDDPIYQRNGGYMVNGGDGNIVVFGTNPGNFNLTKIDPADGSILWDKQLVEGEVWEWAAAICNTNDGGFGCVGFTRYDSGGSIADDVYVVRTDENGMVTDVESKKDKPINIVAYPNPSNNLVTIRKMNEDFIKPLNLVVYNFHGQIVFSKFECFLNSNEIKINLEQGYYSFQLLFDETVLYQETLIIH